MTRRYLLIDADGIARVETMVADAQDAAAMALAQGLAHAVAESDPAIQPGLAQRIGGQWQAWAPPAPAATDLAEWAWNAQQRRHEPVPTVAGRRRTLAAAVDARRDVALRARAVGASGVPFSVAKDRENLAQRIQSRELLGVPAAALTAWKDEDNVIHQASLAFHVALTADMAARMEAVMQHSWTLKAQIAAAATHAALDAIALDEGWP